VEDKSMVLHDEVNGRWELQGLMRHDELGDMGCFVPMRYEVYYEQGPHFLKIAYCYKTVINLQS